MQNEIDFARNKRRGISMQYLLDDFLILALDEFQIQAAQKTPRKKRGVCREPGGLQCLLLCRFLLGFLWADFVRSRYHPRKYVPSWTLFFFESVQSCSSLRGLILSWYLIRSSVVKTPISCSDEATSLLYTVHIFFFLFCPALFLPRPDINSFGQHISASSRRL